MTLSLDTSTMRGSVALLEGKEIRAELRLCVAETHAARLLRSLEFLLGTAACELGDIGLIAACLGPGSFTGIRIGLSTALGLAQTLKVPFAGVSGLDALARSFSYLEGRIGALLDAQRGQVYFAEYASTKGRIRRIYPAGLYYPHDLRVRLAHRRIWLAGDGVGRYLDELGLTAGRAVIVDSHPYLAGAIGLLALERKRLWREGDYLVCEPLYIRPPDAQKAAKRKR